ncbi:MAG: leucine-rich repeat protein, partial [Treponema sp.]|nr:leucine-rich repeat protein [Treponema sp.]
MTHKFFMAAMEHAVELFHKEMAYRLCDVFSVNTGWYSTHIKGVFTSITEAFNHHCQKCLHSAIFSNEKGDYMDGMRAEPYILPNEREFQIEDGVLVKYRGNEVAVTVPQGVTAIGESAFEGCESLVSINLPEGLTTIG